MKTYRLLLFALISVLLILSVHAAKSDLLIYQYTNPEVTVSFSEPLEVSAERQQVIADEIAGITSNTNPLNESYMPNNLICTLFGHDIAPQTTVTATHHKVDKYNPRCLMEVYHVTYCKRCDYAVEELVNDFFIFCCPED
jgi:hypothetical protein